MTHARVLHPSNPDPTPPRYSLLGFLLTICVVSACRPHSSTIFGIAVGVLCKQLAAPTIGALAAARHFPTAAETLPARACTRLASTTRPAAAPPPFATPPPPPALRVGVHAVRDTTRLVVGHIVMRGLTPCPSAAQHVPNTHLRTRFVACVADGALRFFACRQTCSFFNSPHLPHLY